MSQLFFEKPILNSPYTYPHQHWELDNMGQPTQNILEYRRRAEFITPIPKPKKQKGHQQEELVFSKVGQGISSNGQQYDHTQVINAVREQVDAWRLLPNPSDWRVTPETARLLQHWRHHRFLGVRPFFCQLEAVETAIWLTEVAPKIKAGAGFLEHLRITNLDANPDLLRLALKLATGAGKTTVMAMLIAWQTINAVRYKNSKMFSRGFLVVAPGLTIKDRLRVLQPNDPESYFKSRELVPTDMILDLEKAKIVITNYHAFKLRERMELSKGGRLLLQGRGHAALETLESEGQMLQRVIPELMGMKHIFVINDEAHHCYREKPSNEETLSSEEKDEAKENNEAARLWISGLEAVQRKLGISRVMDLSATPFFLRGSGYAEGTLFPWVMSDFSLMDAIECGIVKLPRVPVADNINNPSAEMPMYRDLWTHIRSIMPKKGRGKAEKLDPLDLPQPLQTALEALYGHYKKTFELWQQHDILVPPCFIIVCNNTSTSKLVYDYVSGFYRQNEDGTSILENGRLALFRNYDEYGNALGRPNTLLIDSEQLESGEALDDKFRNLAKEEIELFKRHKIERSGNPHLVETLTDQELLREVMNTVGKPNTLGESIRCVVSVSMLTEGWDANTVTHVLGVRAFGTQLLCEQVIGRALRRQSYDLNEDGLFNTEYADVLGIPFDFTAKPVISTPQPPRQTTHVKAMRPDRDALEIRFPKVQGYHAQLPEERLTAIFTEDSTLVLTPELVGPTQTQNAGIIGQAVNLTVEHLGDMRDSSVLFRLTKDLLEGHFRDEDGFPQLHLFGQLKRICKTWLEQHLICKGDTRAAQLQHKQLSNLACQRILSAITRANLENQPKSIQVVLDSYNPIGSSIHVNFNTTKSWRWTTDSRKSHLNYVILDSDWEAELCRVVEAHPNVRAYVKNQNLGLEVPYQYGSNTRKYLPDFIVQLEDGHGENDLLHLIVEIKGFRGEDAKSKKDFIETYWIPGVNNQKTFGRWAFLELRDVYAMQNEFAQAFTAQLDTLAKGTV
jgi:type III restriction enzyme